MSSRGFGPVARAVDGAGPDRTRRLRAMSTTQVCNQSGDVDLRRRRLIGATAAAVPLGIVANATAQSPAAQPQAVAANTTTTQATDSFGPLRQLRTTLLDIGYAEAGPADGRP